MKKNMTLGDLELELAKLGTPSVTIRTLKFGRRSVTVLGPDAGATVEGESLEKVICDALAQYAENQQRILMLRKDLKGGQRAQKRG